MTSSPRSSQHTGSQDNFSRARMFQKISVMKKLDMPTYLQGSKLDTGTPDASHVSASLGVILNLLQ